MQDELRQHRLRYEGVDVLQPLQMLWFSWITLSDRLERLRVSSTQPEPPITERPSRTNAVAVALPTSSLPDIPEGKTKHNRLVGSYKRYRETYLVPTVCKPGDGRNFRCPLVPPDSGRPDYQRVHCASWQTRHGLLDHL